MRQRTRFQGSSNRATRYSLKARRRTAAQHSEAPGSPQGEKDSDRSPRWSMLLEWAVAAVPPVTILTAIGVWYGYELALARGRYFGLDPTVIDFSTREYVLRSVVAVLGPMLVLLVAVAALMWWHQAVQVALHKLADRPSWRTSLQVAAIGLVLIGIVLVIEGLRAVRSSTVLPQYPVLRSLLVGAGVLAVTYGAWMFRQAGKKLSTTCSEPRPFVPSRAVRHWHWAGYGITAAAVIVSLFWAFSVAAEQRGVNDAAELYRTGFSRLPGVVVYSSTRLSIDGVSEVAVGDKGSTYQWRYSGLRLLVRSKDRYFMVPASWTPGTSSALALDEAPGLRFEFQSPEALTFSDRPRAK